MKTTNLSAFVILNSGFIIFLSWGFFVDFPGTLNLFVESVLNEAIQGK